ncbi:glycoside hydrolase family 3 N-terminal domain-containing protein [Allosediminivita pacifica]|uniref:beta-N-acetylhexosaminidase n=1 Tax=Allosediminivita pacifica TaxID=1267769 RepID=A0A2T6B297_9RHOB|nr:glycoside hydrolase family 3 N-terminal domain-containing protein [Allosediminivita pacifica]PTX50181.1 beta-N-acetylhexosaminidase [Allosediminivita pacifica]GGB02021.1 beta-N-acetylhexosaminidase [Allosediminivita pacifica]
MTAWGAAILGCAGTELSGGERAFFAQSNPFGFILFARNIETANQLRRLTADLREAVGWNAPVFIDQEGGRVQRLRPPMAREWLPPLDDIARLGPDAARGMVLRYAMISHELRGYGIDGNCVPTLDVARPETHAILRNRLYGDTPDAVVDIGKAVLKACLDGGVLPVIKHIPGHGMATLDSHLDLPRVSAPVETLESVDFAPFRAFADAPLAMTAHLVYEALDDAPATISPTMIARIREDIGFGGLLMTDDISMEALSGTVPERAEAALGAGCDIVLHCNGKLDEMTPLMERVGVFGAAAQERAEAALEARRDPETVDIEALEAEFEALINSPDE